MKVRFTVTSFTEPTARLGLVGSLACLGCWDPLHCTPLEPIFVAKDEFKPSVWTALVDISKPEYFEYKYILWHVSDPLPTTLKPSITAETQFRLPRPVSGSWAPPSLNSSGILWEGREGSNVNRKFQIRSTNATSEDEQHLVHTFDESRNTVTFSERHYALPVAEFRGPILSVSEWNHTLRYYNKIRNSNGIDYDKVLDRVFAGSCPRSLKHIQELKEKEGVTDIVNFQSHEDVVNNWPDPQGFPDLSTRTPEALYGIFETQNIRYHWLPTADMSSTARARVLAQSSLIIAAILCEPDTTAVYIHCNAGVGRAIAGTVGYMHCCLDIPIREANLLVCARRSVAYFDEPALLAGAADYRRKFGAASKVLMSAASTLSTSK